MPADFERTIERILRAAEPEERADALYLVLTTAVLAFEARNNDGDGAPAMLARDFSDVVETAGKIWCFLTDAGKRDRFKAQMREVRGQYEGVTRYSSLQEGLALRVRELLNETNDLHAVSFADNSGIPGSLALSPLAS